MKQIFSTDKGWPGLSDKHLGNLSHILYSVVVLGNFRHNDNDVFNECDDDVLSLSSTYMQKQFRLEHKGQSYTDILKTYFVCVDPFYSFGIQKSSTKKYKFIKWVLDDLHEYFLKNEPSVLTRYDDKRKSVKPYSVIPEHAVAKLDKNGLLKKTNFNLPVIIPMNIDNINQGIEDIKSSSSYNPKLWFRYQHLVKLYSIRDALNNTVAPNHYVQLYREGSNGRLYAESNTNFPNIIMMSKTVRSVIFSGMDLYDYDISNCFFAIFLGLCEQVGFDCPRIREYVSDKANLRKIWSKRFRADEGDLKVYFISWFTGCNNSPVEPNSSYPTLGYEVLLAVKNDPFLSDMFYEILGGRKLINELFRNDVGLIVNCLGKIQQREDATKKNETGTELGHILNGEEVRIMQTVNHFIGKENMLAVVFDGWIGNRIDVFAVEAEVKQKLGFDIQFDEKLFEAPPLEKLLKFRKVRKRSLKSFGKEAHEFFQIV